MMEKTEEKIVCDLAEASRRVNDDLDKVEMWTAALGYFQTPVPEYRPGDDYLLPRQAATRDRNVPADA
jgi:hypothetical protein